MPMERPIRLLQDILANGAAERPAKTALICDNRRWTYAQIDDMSSRLAEAFRRSGVRPGDRVLLVLMNGLELVVGIFAALKAQAVFATIDYAATPETLRLAAADCQPAALVLSVLQAETAVQLLDAIPSLRVAVLTGSSARPTGSAILSYDEIQDNVPPINPLPRSIDCDLAYLLYTSGSTGKPKGVMTTHRSALATIESGVEYFGLSERDVVASPLPLPFSPGLNHLMKTFRVGGTLILEKSFVFPAVTLKRMAAEGATAFAAVPTIIALLMQVDLGRYDLSRLRYVSSVGAALAPDLIRQFRHKLPGTLLFSFYGMAEASYCLGLDPGQIDQRPASVGQPFPGTQAWIEDDDGGKLGPDQIGELIVRGSHVRSGYWNDPQASARRFRPGLLPGELVCRTGDLFRMDGQGYFYFVGRGDEMIKSGAKKIAPKEVENALYGLNGILEAAAIGIPDPLLGQVIKAFVVLDDAGRRALDVSDILRYCCRVLEDFKVPRQIEIRDRLPKTSSGKIKKTDLS
jgi:long-chain acyl-CoA synthetase